MSKNCNKVKSTCTGNRNFASCIMYESGVNADSSLDADECPLTLEETTQDIYDQLEGLDLSALGEKCLEYVEDEDGKYIVKNVLIKFEEKICELEEKITALENIKTCDIDLSCCDFDFGSLVDACGNQPTKLCEVIQLILTTINTP